MVLSRVAAAFRDLKGTLDLRPVYHRKETRVETPISLCVLAKPGFKVIGASPSR